MLFRRRPLHLSLPPLVALLHHLKSDVTQGPGRGAKGHGGLSPRPCSCRGEITALGRGDTTLNRGVAVVVVLLSIG